MSFKSNFGVTVKEKEKQKVSEQQEFEEMLRKAGCKGSYMLFENFIDGETPNYIKAINENAREVLYPIWIKNFAENYRYIEPEDNLNKLKAEKKIAVICGGGPSLEKNKHLIERGDKYDIFCVDRSLPRMQHTFVDYAVTVDADDVVAEYYKVKKLPSKTILSCTVSPKVWKVNWGRPDWFIASIDETTDRMMQLMTDLPIIVSQGNVNGVACAIAEHMGYEELILIGYDLGYEITDKGITRETEDQTEDYGFWYDKFKATGASEETIKKAYTTIEHPVFKTKCLSDIMFDGYRAGFYEWLNKTKCIVTNSSEGGSLYHRKMDCKKLEEVLKDGNNSGD